jgi:hypothetical protein
MTINYPVPSGGADMTASNFADLRLDLIRNAGDYGVTGGSANAQTLTIDGQATTFPDGFKVRFKAGFTNTSSTPTLDVNGDGALVMVNRDGGALSPGDIVQDGIFEATKDGSNWNITNFLIRPIPSGSQLKIYGLNSYGDDTSQYDITNPSGDTFRYTYDGTGTDPLIGTHSMIVGQIIDIISDTFDSDNTGTFEITNVGANFFEIENPSGLAENDVTRGTGRIGSPDEYTPSSNAVKIKVEIWGGGGGGTYNSTSVFNRIGGGGGGAYNFKEYFPFELSAPVSFAVGAGGVGTSTAHDAIGGTTTFNGSLTAYGGASGGRSSGTGTVAGRGGGGGGILSAGDTYKGGRPSINVVFPLTSPFSAAATTGIDSEFGGGYGGSVFLDSGDEELTSDTAVGFSVFGGGGGASNGSNTNSKGHGGSSIYGGGGGRSNSSDGTVGTSVYGGNGGSIDENGLMPAGGAGAKSGVDQTEGRIGGSGMVKITEYLL